MRAQAIVTKLEEVGYLIEIITSGKFPEVNRDDWQDYAITIADACSIAEDMIERFCEETDCENGGISGIYGETR